MNAPNASRETMEAYLARGGKITKITPSDATAIARERQASAVDSLRASLNRMPEWLFSVEANASDAGESEAAPEPAPESPVTFREMLATARRAGHRLFPCGACGDDVPFRSLRYDMSRKASVCKACRAKEEAEVEASDSTAVAA